MSMTFAEQYRHPKWQEKRLEAFQRVKELDGALYCERCYDTESQLHVHHKRYVKGRMIWEYPATELEVLCDSCHETAHAEKDELQSILVMMSPDGPGEIISLIKGYCPHIYGPAFVDIKVTEDDFNGLSGCVGHAAALISNRLDFNSISALIYGLSNLGRGGEIVIKIPEKRGFSGLFDSDRRPF